MPNKAANDANADASSQSHHRDRDTADSESHVECLLDGSQEVEFHIPHLILRECESEDRP